MFWKFQNKTHIICWKIPFGFKNEAVQRVHPAIYWCLPENGPLRRRSFKNRHEIQISEVHRCVMLFHRVCVSLFTETLEKLSNVVRNAFESCERVEKAFDKEYRTNKVVFLSKNAAKNRIPSICYHWHCFPVCSSVCTQISVISLQFFVFFATVLNTNNGCSESKFTLCLDN